ncbi:MAG: hypothetical protein IPH81_18310 [Candidatus Microthrix sp.]|nr:hypothetical protein [Candidatus Microthrix sp.]
MHIVEHRHLDYDRPLRRSSPEPEIADVGLVEADAFAEGRARCGDQGPFATTSKALINNDARGFAKIIFGIRRPVSCWVDRSSAATPPS